PLTQGGYLSKTDAFKFILLRVYLELSVAVTAAFVFYLPSKLMIMIAVCLDRKSLCSALLVSRCWNESLRHLFWTVPLMPQLHLAELTTVFTLMLNLTSADPHLDVFSTMADPTMLERFKNLHFNFASLYGPHLDVHFLLVPDFTEPFSKAADFKLELPNRAHGLSMGNVVGADPWAITTLDVEPEAIRPASRCRALEEIVISSVRDLFSILL
ncbi:hypothetical protein BGZ49_003326, partial [Haplosporangium sp. Z 27]